MNVKSPSVTFLTHYTEVILFMKHLKVSSPFIVWGKKQECYDISLKKWIPHWQFRPQCGLVQPQRGFWRLPDVHPYDVFHLTRSPLYFSPYVMPTQWPFFEVFCKGWSRVTTGVLQRLRECLSLFLTFSLSSLVLLFFCQWVSSVIVLTLRWFCMTSKYNDDSFPRGLHNHSEVVLLLSDDDKAHTRTRVERTHMWTQVWVGFV